MTNVVVLGAGMIGSVIAADLAMDKKLKLTVADRSPASLARAKTRTGGRAKTVEADLSDPREIARVIGDADLVVGALPSVFGLSALKTVAERGLRYCDISFMPEDFLSLQAFAKKKGAVCVVDCGVAPGMSNLLAGWGVAHLERATRIDIMVGGVPRHRAWPFEYKAGFAPSDVIEEYVRPARIVEHGKVVIKEALSEPELIDFPGVGTLEVFNTDGLRSLATTLKVPHMRERTMRYPGHIELMRVFRATGLFGLEAVDVNGVQVRPRDLLAKLLFPKWTYEEGEEDLTVMRVIVEGTLKKVPTRLTWDLLDRRDAKTGFTSMSRTTAYPCTSMARMLLDRTVREPGVHPPERLATIKGLLDRMLREQRERGIEYHAHAERRIV
ncbi:MAG: saccharopine dehydrogenase C-terminal domain-containing protein [Phycisphaerae bacterium]|nr:saccharopine dehydrogenase C-terminal domain-containing protein [Phycisphaerae bacterium]